MNLFELAAQHPTEPDHSVPDWMLGFWKRYSISFADGTTDTRTHVCWIQSRNFTIDLRLPLEKDQVPAQALPTNRTDTLRQLANYEGWVADSVWDGHVLTWLPTDTSLQWHNRWPEPAILQRTGNCMIEHCASQSYVEDWRMQASADGPLIGLHLLEERDLRNGLVRHRGGGLIVVGDYAALVLGRPDSANTLVRDSINSGRELRDVVTDPNLPSGALQDLLQFETSVAQRAADTGKDVGKDVAKDVAKDAAKSIGTYAVRWSTKADRLSQSISDWDDFTLRDDGLLVHTLEVTDATQAGAKQIPVQRLYRIDCLAPHHRYALHTPHSESGKQWMRKEAETLTRYTEPFYGSPER